MAEHEWITVLNRRWCLTCDAFQSRKDANSNWRPGYPLSCASNTVYASKFFDAPLSPDDVTELKRQIDHDAN